MAASVVAKPKVTSPVWAREKEEPANLDEVICKTSRSWVCTAWAEVRVSGTAHRQTLVQRANPVAQSTHPRVVHEHKPTLSREDSKPNFRVGLLLSQIVLKDSRSFGFSFLCSMNYFWGYSLIECDSSRLNPRPLKAHATILAEQKDRNK